MAPVDTCTLNPNVSVDDSECGYRQLPRRGIAGFRPDGTLPIPVLPYVLLAFTTHKKRLPR